MKEVLDIASLLKVADLPLGMPTMLLSTPQRRLIAIAHAVLTGTKTRPSLLVVEEPFIGFSAEQQAGLDSVIGRAAFADRISWIGVTSR
jgi:ABC-type branched-subunit amino acid transport system ATPase component